MASYWIYILTNRSGTLYIGMTNDLERRIAEHKTHAISGFTGRYAIDRLVYLEEAESVNTAIEREKQLKRWRRGKKVALIESVNPKWRDLTLDW